MFTSDVFCKYSIFFFQQRSCSWLRRNVGAVMWRGHGLARETASATHWCAKRRWQESANWRAHTYYTLVRLLVVSRIFGKWLKSRALQRRKPPAGSACRELPCERKSICWVSRIYPKLGFAIREHHTASLFVISTS